MRFTSPLALQATEVIIDLNKLNKLSSLSILWVSLKCLFGIFLVKILEEKLVNKKAERGCILS